MVKFRQSDDVWLHFVYIITMHIGANATNICWTNILCVYVCVCVVHCTYNSVCGKCAKRTQLYTIAVYKIRIYWTRFFFFVNILYTKIHQIRPHFLHKFSKVKVYVCMYVVGIKLYKRGPAISPPPWVLSLMMCINVYIWVLFAFRIWRIVCKEDCGLLVLNIIFFST